MVRLYLMIYLALLILVVPMESAGQDGQLAKLSEVQIVVGDLGNEEEKLGLDKNNIKNHVFVFLRSKLPRLVVNDSAGSYVYIKVLAGNALTKSGEISGYFGLVELLVYRPVTINKSLNFATAVLWHNSTAIAGSRDAIVNARKYLDQLLTNFAADWYRDNP